MGGLQCLSLDPNFVRMDRTVVPPASTVVMVRPAAFGFNPETAGSNAFQQAGVSASHEAAIQEFNGLVRLLEESGVKVDVYESPDSGAPDACFPNNWFASMPDGQLVLFPMMAANRRRECNSDSIAYLGRVGNFSDTVDLRASQSSGAALEGTGSIVFDHTHRLAYASRSDRTDTALLEEACSLLGYTPVIFDSIDRTGHAVYHTNVVLHIGDRYAVICSESIPDAEEMKSVLLQLSETGHAVLEVTYGQMEQFACNMIQLRNTQGEHVILLSSVAWDSFSAEQCAFLQTYGHVLKGSIPTIERVGGGSVRCMVAELFTPKVHAS